MVSLRPVGGHATLRRAARRAGLRLLALSPWRIVPRTDAAARASLARALRAPRVVFTSPAAVRAAAALVSLRARRGQRWYAVGAGTAGALRRTGTADVEVPVARMDADGLLALASLQRVAGTAVGVVTAPGGRERISRGLRGRGARVLVAEVYAREPVPPRAAAIRRLLASPPPAWVALTSDGALQQVLASLPDAARARLLAATAVASSPRLAALAQEAGFAAVALAAGPRPADIVAAMRGGADGRRSGTRRGRNARRASVRG